MSANTSCFFSRVFNRDPLSECNILSTYFDGNKQEYDDAIKLYNEFIKKNGNELLKYNNIDLRDPEQRKRRFIKFILIVKQINEHNNDPSQTWSKEINLFTVLEDFEVSKGLKPNPSNNNNNNNTNNTNYDKFKNFSWSNFNGIKNCVSEPKNQLSLDVCWCFAGVEAIETVHAKNNSLETASVENVLDAYSNNDNGTLCLPNILESSLYICGDETTYGTNDGKKIILNGDYIQSGAQTKGISKITKNNEYSGSCPLKNSSFETSDIVNSCVSSFTLHNKISVLDLRSLLDNGPVLAGIDASYIGNHKSGVIGGKKLQCGGSVSPDHVILIIGYGYDEPTKLNYWLCKNSWGIGWGEELPDWAVAPGQTNTRGYFKVEASDDNIICIQGQVAGNIELK